MIIVLKQHSGQKEIDRVENLIKTKGLDTHIVKGAGQTIIGCIGDTSRIDAKLFEVNPYVDKVIHVQEPYKLANRAFHPEDTRNPVHKSHRYPLHCIRGVPVAAFRFEESKHRFLHVYKHP